MPFKPTAIVNFNTIDPKLADNVVNFRDYIWGQENPAINMKARLLLSLANGVGAGRMRQAVREFVKAYSIVVTTEEFSELFAMFAWNQVLDILLRKLTLLPYLEHLSLLKL